MKIRIHAQLTGSNQGSLSDNLTFLVTPAPDDAKETACFDASTRETASAFATYAYTTRAYAARVYATSDGAAAGQAGSLTGRDVNDGRDVASPGTSSATEAPAASSIGGAFVGSYARSTTGSTTGSKTRLWVNKATRSGSTDSGFDVWSTGPGAAPTSAIDAGGSTTDSTEPTESTVSAASFASFVTVGAFFAASPTGSPSSPGSTFGESTGSVVNYD